MKVDGHVFFERGTQVLPHVHTGTEMFSVTDEAAISGRAQERPVPIDRVYRERGKRDCVNALQLDADTASRNREKRFAALSPYRRVSWCRLRPVCEQTTRRLACRLYPETRPAIEAHGEVVRL